jgi:hypothetical protein
VRPGRIALAAGLVALAVLLALLATDLRAWRETLRADDLRFRSERGSTPAWTASMALPSRLSRGLLGVDDDRALRRAVAAFRSAEEAQGGFETGFVRRHLRGDAEATLNEVVGSGNPAQAAQASDLFGVLAFADATTGRRSAAPVERSQSAFENAVRLDPGNVAAKYNLELLLRLIQARGQRIGANPAPGAGGGGQRGAGSGTPGRGY